jgi:hypothetical protein
LDANYSVTISGGFGDSKTGDIILSGNGPDFRVELLGLTIRIVVSLKDAEYSVYYTINDSCFITGTYYATLGEPFTVLQAGDKMISITIDKTKQKQTN